MKSLFSIILFLLAVIILTGCPGYYDDYDYVPVEISETPVNFSEVNSAYDDYNSAFTGPSEGVFALVFSTNKASGGVDFDLTRWFVKIETDDSNGSFALSATDTAAEVDIDWEFNGFSTYDQFFFDFRFLDTALPSINNGNNQYGPYFSTFNRDFSIINTESTPISRRILFYAEDVSSDLDIYFVYHKFIVDFYCREDPDCLSTIEFQAEKNEVPFLNSDYDDAYPTFNSDYTEIYFTSNRDGSFNIFRTSLDVSPDTLSYEYSEVDVIELLTDASHDLPIEKVSILSSSYNDKCPMIFRDFTGYSDETIVFSSDREGGYGGYDLWYAVGDGEGWSDPINMGEIINSEYDEYRPYLFDVGVENTLLIFSSDRPGGKGGFDLYYAGFSP